MKAIVITPENRMRVEEYTEPLYKTVGRTVDGWIEVVHPVQLPEPYCMIVNEEGLLRGLPDNLVGCILYGTPHHGIPIVGTIVLMKEGTVDGEPDIIGLNEHDIQTISAVIATASSGKVRVEEPT